MKLTDVSVFFFYLLNCSGALTYQVSLFLLFLFPLCMSSEFHTWVHGSFVLRFKTYLTALVVCSGILVEEKLYSLLAL